MEPTIGINDLKKLFPKDAEDWDVDANGCGPERVTPGSDKW